MKKRKLWFVIFVLVIGVSLFSLTRWGLRYGIDFTGGSLMELSFEGPTPSPQAINDVVGTFFSGQTPSVQPIGTNGMVIRFKDIDENTHQQILEALKTSFPDNPPKEERFDSIGPSVGEALKKKTVQAVILACLLIIAYITWAFRHVSKPVASWKYGVNAIIALAHDVIVVLGVFSLLGHYYGMEVNAPFIAAILTVLGYSVNDTIVIFDRIRENLMKNYSGDLESTIDKSINESVMRSLYTTATVIMVLFAILLFGGSSVRDFSLALIIGIIAGTYSSIFVASPLLLVFQNLSLRKKK